MPFDLSATETTLPFIYRYLSGKGLCERGPYGLVRSVLDGVLMFFFATRKVQHVAIVFCERSVRSLSIVSDRGRIEGLAVQHFSLPKRTIDNVSGTIVLSDDSKAVLEALVSFCMRDKYQRLVYMALPEEASYWCADIPTEVERFGREIDELAAWCKQPVISSQIDLGGNGRNSDEKLYIAVRRRVVDGYLRLLSPLVPYIHGIATQHLAQIQASSDGEGLYKNTPRIFLGGDKESAILSLWSGPRLLQKERLSAVASYGEDRSKRAFEEMIVRSVETIVEASDISLKEVFLCGLVEKQMIEQFSRRPMHIEIPSWRRKREGVRLSLAQTDVDDVKRGVFDECIGLIGMYQRELWQPLTRRMCDADKSLAL